MRRGIIMLLASALVIAPAAHAQSEPVADKGDQFAPKETGTVEKLRFWYGPYAVPPGNDYNRFDLNLPVRDGYVLSIEPGLKRVQDMSVPTHQEAHIHHAHWLRFDPGQRPRQLHIRLHAVAMGHRRRGDAGRRAAADEGQSERPGLRRSDRSG